MHETHKRSVVKAVSYRILGTLITGIIVFAFTGSFSVSFGVAGIELFAKLLAYYFHERIWDSVGRGKYSYSPNRA